MSLAIQLTWTGIVMSGLINHVRINSSQMLPAVSVCQPEEGEVRIPDEAGEHDVPSLPPKGLLPTREQRRGQRLGHQDRPPHQTPSDDDVSPTEMPQGVGNVAVW